MKRPPFAFLVQLAAAFTWCFHVAAAGGSTTLQTFYCSEADCANHVTKVFCNDQLLGKAPVGACGGQPLANGVCQRGGRAFVSTDLPGSCEFEGHSYITTEKCTDYTAVCKFTSATTPSPPVQEIMNEAPKDYILHIILVFLGVVIIVLVAVTYFCKKKQKRAPNQQPDRDAQGELRRLSNGHCPVHDPGA